MPRRFHTATRLRRTEASWLSASPVEADKPSLTPAWISRDLQVPDPPVVANGVVYAIQTGEQTIQNPTRPGGDKTGNPPPAAAPAPAPLPADPVAAALESAKFRATLPVSHQILYAFDAETGKQLYSSDKILAKLVHFNEPVVALGKVFVVSWDGHITAFGLKP